MFWVWLNVRLIVLMVIACELFCLFSDDVGGYCFFDELCGVLTAIVLCFGGFSLCLDWLGWLYTLIVLFVFIF